MLISTFINLHICQSLRLQTNTFVNLHAHKPTHLSISTFTNLHICQSLRLQTYTFVNLYVYKPTHLSISTFTSLHIRQFLRSQSTNLCTFVSPYVHNTTQSSISAFTNQHIRRFLDSQTYTFVNLTTPKPPKFVGLYNSKHPNSLVSTLYASLPLHSSLSNLYRFDDGPTLHNHESVYHQQRQSSPFIVLFIRFLILHDP